MRMRTGALRELLRNALPIESAEYGAPPPAHQFYVPKSHARALHINIPVVLGDRGMGKSYWWAALQSREHRGLLSRLAPSVGIKEETLVSAGFGKTLSADQYPSKDALDRLLKKNLKPRLIWKTIVTWQVGRLTADFGFSTGDGHALTGSRIPPVDTILPDLPFWEERVCWLENNPETVDHLLQKFDSALHALDRDSIWVFDALDDAADNPSTFYSLVEGLCQFALELRSYRRLRAKVFLRTDQFEDPRVGRFPDAAKLRASTASLRWLTTELYGLLWQLLCNYPEIGSTYRQDLYATIYERKLKGQGLSGAQQREILQLSQASQWELPSEAKYEASVQERLFHRLTGPYMGENARKGFPYRWLPTHLSDAHGDISPRSFTTALTTAVEHTIDHYREHEFAIHYRSLHAGVREASRIRVGEIAEHPWIQPLMAALAGSVGVPFAFSDAALQWDVTGALNNSAVESAEIVSSDLALLRLTQLGVWREMKTGRIDVPDIYRLGFNLSRRGGVPLKRDGEINR